MHIPYAHFLRVPSLMNFFFFASNKIGVPHGLAHFASCDCDAVVCVIYCNNTQKIAFKLDEKYIQHPSFYLPCLQGTKYARYIGISNIFVCLRSFLLFFRCHGHGHGHGVFILATSSASPCWPPFSMHSACFSGFPGCLAGPPSAIKSIAFNKSQTQIRTSF